MAKIFRYYLPSLQLSIRVRVLNEPVLDLKLTDLLVVGEYKYREFLHFTVNQSDLTMRLQKNPFS